MRLGGSGEGTSPCAGLQHNTGRDLGEAQCCPVRVCQSLPTRSQNSALHMVWQVHAVKSSRECLSLLSTSLAAAGELGYDIILKEVSAGGVQQRRVVARLATSPSARWLQHPLSHAPQHEPPQANGCRLLRKMARSSLLASIPVVRECWSGRLLLYIHASSASYSQRGTCRRGHALEGLRELAAGIVGRIAKPGGLSTLPMPRCYQWGCWLTRARLLHLLVQSCPARTSARQS